MGNGIRSLSETGFVSFTKGFIRLRFWIWSHVRLGFIHFTIQLQPGEQTRKCFGESEDLGRPPREEYMSMETPMSRR